VLATVNVKLGWVLCGAAAAGAFILWPRQVRSESFERAPSDTALMSYGPDLADSAEEAILAVSGAVQEQASESRMAAALEMCQLPAEFAYPIPLMESDPNSCARIGAEFGLPPAEFCALVATEASMHSPTKDNVQNALAAWGMNPSLGLKSADETTVGCSQMSGATAVNVLEKLADQRPDLFERLGLPEGELDRRQILRRLASDCRFAMVLQAAYAMLNVQAMRPGPEGSAFSRFVKDIYNPHNEELHVRFDCLQQALATP